MTMRPGGGLGRGMRNFMTEEEKANAPKVTKELLARIFSWLKPYYVQFLLTLLCIIISSFLSILPSVLTGEIIDKGLIGRNLPLLIRLILLSFLAAG